ncbi:unnamed protein product, partial [Porites evermanni]
VAVSSLGCYEEQFYSPLFKKVYLDYRSQIDWNKYPDMSHVIQACAQAAVARQYTYFAITYYGVCVWGPDGLKVTSTRELDSWCFAGLGGLSLVSVYKIKSLAAGTAYSVYFLYCEQWDRNKLQKKTKRNILLTFKPLNCILLVNGGWSEWGSWTSCSHTCGGGSQTRMRTCTNPPPSGGGADCQGGNSQSQSCNTDECTVDGNWSEWGVWGSCSQTCGGDFKRAWQSSYSACPSNTIATQQKVILILVNGGWTLWGVWGSCSQTCGGGSQSRMRSCTNPPPSGGGAKCQGSSSQSQSCNTNRCPVKKLICLIDLTFDQTSFPPPTFFFNFSGCQEGSSVHDQCGQRCTCIGGQLVNCVRIRKEFTAMTFEERKRYIKTIKTASTDPRWKTEYDNLLNSHRILFLSGIHQRDHFLTWHRWFILQYENLLRQVDCNFTIAYWDWSAVSSNPFSTANKSDLWHSADTGFGGDGGGISFCVQTGPFRENEWSIVPLPAGSPPEPGPRCLVRMFNGNPPDTVAVERVLKTEVANFTDFELMLRINLHDLVHCLIDGTMCSIDSAAAPEFFLHHGFIDKIWDDWQKKSEAHKNVFFSTINQIMPGTQLLPRAVIDLSSQPGGVIVEYLAPRASTSAVNLLRSFRLSKLKRLRRRRRRRFSQLRDKIFKVFHLKKSEIRKAKEFEKMLQPKN